MQVKGLKELNLMVLYQLIRLLNVLFQVFLRPLLANVSTTVRITRESMNRTHTGSCT